VGEIPLYFYIPMFPWKDFLMGWIRKIQKHKEESDGSGNFKKTRRKEWRKEKEEIFYIHGGSHTRVCSPSIENTRRLPPLCDPPSGEPTGMGTSPTTKHKAIYTKMLYVYVKMFQSPIDMSVFLNLTFFLFSDYFMFP
jgi:hypothetical protein